MKPSLLLAAFILILPLSLRAEPDKLVRALLGVNSLPVRFTPAKDDQYYQLAIAKFKDGKFIGYCDLHGGTDSFSTTTRESTYEAEFAWAKHDGQYGFLLLTPNWTQNFSPDPFFGNGLGLTHYFAYNRPPQGKIGPFSVLGIAVGGDGKLPTDEQNVSEWIKGYPYAAVFLLAPCRTLEQAEHLAKSMPQLSAD